MVNSKEGFEIASENVAPIFYREIGAGSPLLLIHGSFSNGAATWAGQMEELRHYHRLIVVDRRGHGQSPADPRPYTIAGDAGDALEAADRAGAGEIHVVGHSYGGMVALEMARIAPHRIKSLHLIEPPYLSLMQDDSDVSSVIERGRDIFRNAARVGPEHTATAFMEMLIGPAGLADLRESPAWPGIVREAGRTAYEQFPIAYPPESLAELSVGLPGPSLYRRAQPSRSAKAGAPAGGADTGGRPGRRAGRHSRGAAIHRALPPGAARGRRVRTLSDLPIHSRKSSPAVPAADGRSSNVVEIKGPDTATAGEGISMQFWPILDLLIGANTSETPLGQIGAGSSIAGCWLARLRSELSDERRYTTE